MCSHYNSMESLEILSISLQLLDYLEPIMAEGGKIVDYHSCEFFPERWFDIVYVMQCENSILFDRLTQR